MNISIIAFTQRGAEKAKQCKTLFKEHHCELYSKPSRDGFLEVTESLEEWCQHQFTGRDAIIFIGATGIAVRGIAKSIKDKLRDPAVLVMDEMGCFVIPLLSGHVGGANALAMQMAEWMGATPVITTATDLSKVFAIDVFAKNNQLKLDSDRRDAYKKISAFLLEGMSVGIWMDASLHYEGEVPVGLVRITDEEWEKYQTQKPPYPYIIAITDKELPKQEWIVALVPVFHVVGIGCKKNTEVWKLQEAFYALLAQQKLSAASIGALASIDVKQYEPAILSLAKKLEIPFQVYSSDTLNQMEGEFTTSDFVKKTVGVDNVCERAAVVCMTEKGQTGKLLVRKTAFDGITLAIAGGLENRRIRFE